VKETVGGVVENGTIHAKGRRHHERAFMGRRFCDFCSAHGTPVSVLKLYQNALGVKCVSAFQNEAPFVRLNVVAANGTTVENVDRADRADRANRANIRDTILYILYIFFIYWTINNIVDNVVNNIHGEYTY
jgi:hypothetical protein